MIKRGVLIVGGGPTGMTLGLQLQRYGVPFRIIEKRRPEPSPSKALSINTASLHLLSDFGIADELAAHGRHTEVVTVHYNNRRVRRMRFNQLASRYPYFLMLPQPETEAALERRLAQTGHAVERDCELLSLTQNADSVTVQLRNGSSTEEQVYDYVAGCDGGLSRVRSEIGFEFTGYDYSMYFLLADVKLHWSGNKQEGHYFVQDDGFMIVLPLKNGYHRIVLKAEGLCPPGYKPTLAEIQTQVARYQVGDLAVDDPIWLSSAPFYNRSAPAFGKGRVFLAGDAAHMFSPIGGFGMNTGIGDGFNLGWKLGFAHRGLATPALLQSYDDERHANTQKLLRKTDLSTSLIARLDRHQAQDEARFAPHMSSRSAMRLAPSDAAGLTISYGQPDGLAQPGAPLQVGRMLPYVAGNRDRADSLALVGQGVYRLVIALDGSAEQLTHAQTLVANLQLASSNLIRPLLLLSNTPAWSIPPQDHVMDRNGTLARNWHLANGEFALIRPDLFVACLGRLEAPSQLYGYLAKWHGFGMQDEVRHAA